MVRWRRDRGIDEANVADDLDSLGGGSTGVTPLCRIHTSSATTPAISRRSAPWPCEAVEMTDVKESVWISVWQTLP
jgi:hypothetical protein